MYEVALKIFSKEEGERSVTSAKTIGAISFNNYKEIQLSSTQDYTVARKQAETAVEVIEEKLGKKNILIVDPKNTVACIMKAKANVPPDKEEKLRLLSEAEKLGAECLTILTATLGKYNPATAIVMMNMGST